MNLLDIAKTAGAAAFSLAVPGGAAILATVNALLPDEHKLPTAATGHDICATVSALSPEQKALVMSKEFDVELAQIKESNGTLRVMLQADAASTHTTRPYIAKGSFQLVAAVSLLVVSLWAFAVGSGNVEMVGQIMGGWEFVAAVLTPFVALLWAYFGILKQEHQNRLTGGNTPPGPAGVLGIISSALGKR